MLEQAYTVRDSPEAVRRIEHDLQIVRDELQEADPALRSLILTGGFARGEGGVLDGIPQNDYDFVAVRGWGRPRTSYQELGRRLTTKLGLHIDLSTIASWRVPWVARSIFWYETATAGRTIWGENVLPRIPIRDARNIDAKEGLRLLTNRAAGLLLVTEKPPGRDHLIQASKALLAVADVHLLARGEFPPRQRERSALLETLRRGPGLPPDLESLWPSLDWAYRFKVEPGAAAPRDPDGAWRVAANALLDAIPHALAHAHFPSLERYARSDGLVDHWFFWRRTGSLIRNPTGRVRVATLRLLEAAQDGRVRPEVAREHFAAFGAADGSPLARLRQLRASTLQ